MPERIQLRRTKGFRKPKDPVVVARPTRWGNPFTIGVHGDRATCVASYCMALAAGELAFTNEDARLDLAGRDLAC